jgi:replicative DNA helicase
MSMDEKKAKSLKNIKGVVNELLPVYKIDKIQTEYVKTGFIGIDKITKGFCKKELNTIAVRPGMGKTAFLLSLITNISVMQGRKLAVFSLDRSAESLIKRLIESETGFSVNKIQSKEIPEESLQHVKSLINNISNSTILIDDCRLLSIDELKIKAKNLIKQFGVEIIMIDYLQVMHSHYNDKRDTEEMKTEIALELRKLAREIDIPIVLFSQINKPINPDDEEKSILLRDLNKDVSEQSDSVLIIYRSDFFHLNFDLSISGGQHKALAEIIIAKNPNIKTKQSVTVQFLESMDRFVDLK